MAPQSPPPQVKTLIIVMTKSGSPTHLLQKQVGRGTCLCMTWKSKSWKSPPELSPRFCPSPCSPCCSSSSCGTTPPRTRPSSPGASTISTAWDLMGWLLLCSVWSDLQQEPRYSSHRPVHSWVLPHQDWERYDQETPNRSSNWQHAHQADFLQEPVPLLEQF